MDSQTTLTISEGYDLPTQQHYTKKKFSCCDCFHRQCTFRLWQILVFLLVIAFIIAVMGLLIAMLGPGNTNLKYSKTSKSESKAENPTNKIHTGNLLITGAQPKAGTGLKMQTVRFFNVTLLGIYR